MVFSSGCLWLFPAIVPGTLFQVIHQEYTELTPTLLSVTSLGIVLALLLQVGSPWHSEVYCGCYLPCHSSFCSCGFGIRPPFFFHLPQDGSCFVAVLSAQSSEMQNYWCSGGFFQRYHAAASSFGQKTINLFPYLEIFISWGYLSISHLFVLEKKKKREPCVLRVLGKCLYFLTFLWNQAKTSRRGSWRACSCLSFQALWATYPAHSSDHEVGVPSAVISDL